MPAGLLRRLAAIVYDTLLIIALWMVVTAAFLLLSRGEAITPERDPVLEFVYRAALVTVVVIFYGLPWTRRGQTLGMASWRLKVVREDGSLLDWRDTVVRLLGATLSLLVFGLGFMWILVDPERRAWHDRLSRTVVVVLPKGSG
jgi:uncharacterized RDD family membrane protein YckC